MTLEGKVAIVTGSSRGLGKAMALAFAGAGADVVVVGRTEQPGGPIAGTIQETAEAVRQLGRRALPVRCDVSNDDDVEALAKQVLETFGRADILVNNAAAAFWASFADTNIRRFDLLFRVNTRAFFLCTKAFLPMMIEQKWGHILSVSPPPVTDISGSPLAQMASKQAITLMSLGLAKEVAPHNVAVNCLFPEGQRTSEGMLYAFRDADKSDWLTPQVFADAALAIVSKDPAAFTGQAVTDLGMLKLEGVTDLSKYKPA